jgi:tRNA uridine 5-carboxymethylaminomethyl modification enzyme
MIRLSSISVDPRSFPPERAVPLIGQPIDRDYTLAELLRRPEVRYRALAEFAPPGVEARAEALGLDRLRCEQVVEQLEIQSKYAGYIARQRDEVARHAHNEQLPIPPDFDYASVRGLSNEVRSKLVAQRPATVGAASRISGVTPAAMSLLLVYLKKRRGHRQAA